MGELRSNIGVSRPGWQEECQNRILESIRGWRERGKWNVLSTENSKNRVKMLENKEEMLGREAGENPAMLKAATARLCARQQQGHTCALGRGLWLWCEG